MSLLTGSVFRIDQFCEEKAASPAEVVGDLEWLDDVQTAFRTEQGMLAAEILGRTRIVVVQKQSIPTDFVEYQGLIAISSRARQFFDVISRECEFVPVNVNKENWFWVFPRSLEVGCLDAEKTTWRTLRNGTRVPEVDVFDGSMTSGAAIFRLPCYLETVFCSRGFAQALLDSDLKGFFLEDHSCGKVLTSDDRGMRRKEYFSKDIRAYRARQAARSSEKLPFPEVTGKVSADDLGSLLRAPLFYTRFLQIYPLALRRLRSSGPDPKVFVSDCELLKEPGAVVSLNRSLWEDPVTSWSEDLPENKWPREFIAIGEDKCGNYFLVKSGDESGAVWFYNHDGGTFTRRYAHIDDFVKELVEGRYKAPFGPF